MRINKKKIIVISCLATFVGLGLYTAYIHSDEHFLPFLRYKSVTEWRGPRRPWMSIAERYDQTYWISVDYSQTSRKTWENGDGWTHVEITYTDGFLSMSSDSFHPKDSTIAKMGNIESKKNSSSVQIIPLKTGRTRLYLSDGEIRDSIDINITRRKNRLRIDQD